MDTQPQNQPSPTPPTPTPAPPTPRIPPFANPFRPGAGHIPPYLAGRETEEQEFRELLKQDVVLKNLILTGLRGVGKTVLLETLKPIAIQEKWAWVGTDLSESSSISEDILALRIITDLSVVTSNITIADEERVSLGFGSAPLKTALNFATLFQIYKEAPGLVADKLKAILELVARHLGSTGRRGIIFAYDEAQNLADHAQKEQYPLSVLLDVFQSIQRKNIPFMLVLVGLPTLFPKLVEARTYSERMFHVIFLDRLNEESTREAILKPIEKENCPVKFSDGAVKIVVDVSGGYPYFIQFICREIYDVWIQKIATGQAPSVPVDELVRKLDTDFFAGRWSQVTDRQRELLGVVAQLETCDNEFTVQEVTALSTKKLSNPFTASHVNQMFASLADAGIIYKNRHGKYSFAVPLLSRFIKRQLNIKQPSPPAAA
jgi:AAA+ ATPase superfamily predicted ATPase